MDTSSYDLCSVFSKDELQRLIQGAKAHQQQQQQQKRQSRQKCARQKQPAHVSCIVSPEQRIDSLAIKYRETLRVLLQSPGQDEPQHSENANIDTPDSCDRFTRLLARISEIGDEFEIQAREELARSDQPEEHQERLVHGAWQTLVYWVFDQPMLRQVDQWMFVSASCIALMLCKIRCGQLPPDTLAKVDADVVARLQRYRQTSSDGTSTVVDICRHDDSCLGNDDLAAEISATSRFREFGSDVCSSAEKISRFVSGVSRGCQALARMNALKYTMQPVLDAVARVVDTLVQTQAGQWGSPGLSILRGIVSQTAATIDALLVHAGDQAPQTFQKTVGQFAEQQLFERFSDLRTHELFSIIIEFPSSTAAIDDLRQCVGHLDSMRRVAESLRTAVEKRLLHPGATTGDILMQYISAIRCLRLLDPSSTVLEIVAQPIRAYLRLRDDTVSSIVQDMVSEESELFEDLASGALIQDNDPEGVVYDEDYADKSWEPLPIEAKNTYQTAQRRDADVLGLLVSIYDSKDVFVREFECHLSRNLLSRQDYDASREIKQVEMMKLRFGDRALEKCEVMLKDMAESKRTDQLIAEAGRERQWDMPLHAIVVSRQFWEAAAPERFVMPREMAEMKEKYAGVYESLRPARKLEWRDSLGKVRLAVQLADRSLDIAVSPAQAAVLMAFDDGGSASLTVSELAEQLECGEEFVLPRLRFWQTQGVLREVSPNTFEPIEHREAPADYDDGSDDAVADRSGAAADMAAGDTGRVVVGGDDDEDGDESDSGEASEQAGGSSGARTETLRMHFNYIVAMLTNIGPLPLDRIHGMLGMFIPGDTTTIDELRGFLALMVREDRLELSGGMYKLK
ncbi:Anaphase-promoting complex subunit 2 [Coemansia sp. RSA 2599]|nr:Anaphase-promoting complex subunit 2 [Coemansia sp. RSA 2599]